jgi:hypothetical protein
MASQKNIDELVEMFLNDLNDEEKQDTIDKLEKSKPKAAKILKTAWEIEQRSDKIDNIIDRVQDEMI